MQKRDILRIERETNTRRNDLRRAFNLRAGVVSRSQKKRKRKSKSASASKRIKQETIKDVVVMLSRTWQKIFEDNSRKGIYIGDFSIRRSKPLIYNGRRYREVNIVIENDGEHNEAMKFLMKALNFERRNLLRNHGLRLDIHSGENEIPDDIFSFDMLRYLRIFDAGLTTLPNSFGKYLRHLQKLVLRENELTSLPDNFGVVVPEGKKDKDGFKLKERGMAKLINLDLSKNTLKALPDSFGNLINLVNLSLQNNQLKALPNTFGNLINLVILRLQNNQLKALPDTFGNLTNLNSLTLHDNQLESLPDTFGNLTNLELLTLEDNHLDSLPDTFGKLTKLETLNLAMNPIAHMPTMGENCQLRSVDLQETNVSVQRKTEGFENCRTLMEDPDRIYMGGEEEDIEHVMMEVHDQYNKNYKRFETVLLPEVQEFVNERTGDTIHLAQNVLLADTIRVARDQLATTLTDEKDQEKLVKDLNTLSEKVLEAKLDPRRTGYAKVVSTMFTFIKALKNENITLEYLSRFTDESLNAYHRRKGDAKISCTGGIRERLTSSITEMLRVMRDQLGAKFPVSDGVMRALQLYEVLEKASKPGFITEMAGRWSYTEEGPKTEEGAASYITKGILKDFAMDEETIGKDKYLVYYENLYDVVLDTIPKLEGNFDCKDRDEVFTNKDCETESSSKRKVKKR